MAVDLFLFRESKRKIMKMMTPEPSAWYDETYCILSYYQIRIAQAMNIMMIVIKFYPVLYLATGSAYTHFYFTQEQRECNDSSWDNLSAMQYVRMVSYSLMSQLALLAALTQVFEYTSMIMLILAQRNKTIGEILYDHNSENMSEPLTLQQLKSAQRISRRRELFLKKVFQVLTVIFILSLLFFEVSLYILGRFYLAYALFICVVMLALYTSFFTIYCLMKKYHHYEFQKHSNPMLMYMFSYTIAGLTNALLLYMDSKISDYYTMRTYVDECDKGTYLYLQLACLFFPLTNIQYLLCLMSLIVYKKTDDVLQGVSKLDYLLKVSVFQIYKNP